jgi:hypothetical protein
MRDQSKKPIPLMSKLFLNRADRVVAVRGSQAIEEISHCCRFRAIPVKDKTDPALSRITTR